MPAADDAAPLADGELEGLFHPLVDTTAAALAVSGGADSLALLAAVERWRLNRRRPRIVVLTVDHGLRPESADEAREVMRLAQEAGMEGRVLTVSAPLGASDVEAAAREARYRLLFAAAREAGASHLVTAHHRDDQAETVLMRLQRGSGVFGLSAMRREVEAGGVVLFRPFLSLPRSRLAATAAAADLVPHEDPMNRDPRFLRARIRGLMPLLVAEGFDPAGIAETATRLAEAAEAIDVAATRLAATAVAVDDCAVASLDRDRFLAEPAAVRQRLLVRLLGAIGGESYPPRAERLAALHGAIAAHAGGGGKRTLAGVVVAWREGTIQAWRETGREGLPAVAAPPGKAVVFDHRFRVVIGADAPSGLDVVALGAEGRVEAGLRRAGVPSAALDALPALRRSGRLVAIPTVGWWSPSAERFAVEARETVSERLARPPAFPDY